ncbi:MAG: DUF4276 family protein [Deltaproteobacteria bacterium]|nr:DUF4276 family protein [Deltaproteobacteria bacterium]
MPLKEKGTNKKLQEVSLFFVEGETEIEFYTKEIARHFPTLKKRIINLHGNSNIHRKVLGKAFDFINKNKEYVIRIFCCVDRESRDHNPPLDINELSKSICENPLLEKHVISVDKVIATQMIESWFFYDIEGIYRYLRAPRKERNPSKYQPPEKYTHIDLSKLFERYGKTYIKGKKCKYFIDNLDIIRIYNECQELKDGIKLVEKRIKASE